MTSLFYNFDFAVLEDPHFKEDSVREELVAPLLHAGGYASTGFYQIKRSLPLQHPFVSIGSQRKAIYIYPDYVLLAGARPLWILDAKAPNEPLDDPEHLSQAYSYAVHGDVRANWFALCNGRTLALYHLSLLENNGVIAAGHEPLTEKTREGAGGRFKVSRWTPIEWLVYQYHSDLKAGGGTQTYEGTYLVQHQAGDPDHRYVGQQ